MKLIILLLSSTVLLSLSACDSGEPAPGEGTGQGASSGDDAGSPSTPEPQPVQTITISTGFAETILEGVSGGSNPAARLGANTDGSPCLGNVGDRPDFILAVTGPLTATFAVVAEADTTLAIVGPGGCLCNDDSDGLNPGLLAELQSGSYEIFVGNFSLEEGPTPYALTILPLEAAAPIDPVPEPVPEPVSEGTEAAP